MDKIMVLLQQDRKRLQPSRNSRAIREVAVVAIGVLFFFRETATAKTTTTTTRTLESLNPLQQGCLYHHNLTNQIRICGSEDPPELIAQGICRPSPFDYDEIRLLPSDWESTYFETWILQILLSEMLGVPTSVETGSNDISLDLYDPNNSLGYPIITDFWSPLKRAYNLSGDCSKADRSSSDTYEVCGHFKPEAWNTRNKAVQDMVQEGNIEPLQTLGMLGQESWFVPRYTAERDPSLLSYIGLQGESNRQKLAERFQKPVVWSEYCAEISTNNCSTPDAFAQRAPVEEEDEHNKYFVPDLYTGYFRQTQQSNCTANPNDCRGYMMDFPCNWGSPVPTQIHYLGIALDTRLDEGGYSYGELIQIWRAANATKSDVMMLWWTPDTLVMEFQGTDAEFTRVQLPPANQACMDNRVANVDHCNPDLTIRYGSPEGVCQNPPNQIKSLITSTVYHQSYGNNKPEAIFSPAHSALSSFQINELQMEEIFSLWRDMGDAREAVCQWVVDNRMEYMETFVPRSYPRAIEEKDERTPLMYATTSFGIFVAASVVVMTVMVHKQHGRQAIRYAQMEFLDLLLLGALLITIGAVTIGMPSTSGSCIAEIWLVHTGYTAELAPLIVKIAAVTHVMDSGKKMRRVTISRPFLFGIVAFISILVWIFLLVWTVVDPPTVHAEYELSQTQNNNGETLVWVQHICQSESMIWSYIAVAWNGSLLLITSIYAIKMRKININGFCETGTLALLVYSHFVFVLLRVITYMLTSHVSNYVLSHCRSLIFSFDTLATLLIYFVPKFLAPDTPSSSRIHMKSESWSSGISGHSTVASNGLRKSKEHVDAVLKKQEQEKATSLDSATLARIMDGRHNKAPATLKAGGGYEKPPQEGASCNDVGQSSSELMNPTPTSSRRSSKIRASLVLLAPENWATTEFFDEEEPPASDTTVLSSAMADPRDEDTLDSLRRKIYYLEDANKVLSNRNTELEGEIKVLLER